MRVFIQSDKNGVPCNYNFANAYQGFREMGFEIVLFNNPGELSAANKEDIVVGYVNTVKEQLYKFGVICPNIDYPDRLSLFLRRHISQTKLSTVANNPERWPVFIKPIEDKQFTGVVVRSPKDLVGCGSENEDRDIYCSEVVNFTAEWRCFVRYSKILDVRQYKGGWKAQLNTDIVENAVRIYTDAPAGYAIDFGLTSDKNTIIVEVNDGYALGCYGLNCYDYAKLLSARWAELTNTADNCNFDLVFNNIHNNSGGMIE